MYLLKYLLFLEINQLRLYLYIFPLIHLYLNLFHMNIDKSLNFYNKKKYQNQSL